MWIQAELRHLNGLQKLTGRIYKAYFPLTSRTHEVKPFPEALLRNTWEGNEGKRSKRGQIYQRWFLYACGVRRVYPWCQVEYSMCLGNSSFPHLCLVHCPHSNRDYQQTELFFQTGYWMLFMGQAMYQTLYKHFFISSLHRSMKYG